MKKAVFLDRDGVINEDFEYVHRVEDFRFIPGVFEALRGLKEFGFLLIVVTNQSGIGRGYYSVEDMQMVHGHMVSGFKKAGIVIDRIYYCPHAPEDDCACRKPRTEMLEMAKNDFGIDLSCSYLIGDKTKDVKTAKNAGCSSILVMTGKAGSDREFDVRPDFIAKDLIEAKRMILNWR